MSCPQSAGSAYLVAIVLCVMRLRQVTSRHVDLYRLRGAAKGLTIAGAVAAVAAMMLTLYQLLVRPSQDENVTMEFQAPDDKNASSSAT